MRAATPTAPAGTDPARTAPAPGSPGRSDAGPSDPGRSDLAPRDLVRPGAAQRGTARRGPAQPAAAGSATAKGRRTADDQLVGSLRIAVMRLTRRLRAERSEEALTLTQISALSTLERQGPLSPTSLAEHERVQPPSMTRVIAVLEELGLAKRAPHPSDRRQSVIAISPAGRDLLEENRRRRNAWLARAMQALTPEERTILRAAVPVLERLGEA